MQAYKGTVQSIYILALINVNNPVEIILPRQHVLSLQP